MGVHVRHIRWTVRTVVESLKAERIVNMLTSLADIPMVDFSSLSLNLEDAELDETKMKLTAGEMVDALYKTGFVYLSNTHFPDRLV